VVQIIRSIHKFELIYKMKTLFISLCLIISFCQSNEIFAQSNTYDYENLKSNIDFCSFHTDEEIFKKVSLLHELSKSEINSGITDKTTIDGATVGLILLNHEKRDSAIKAFLNIDTLSSAYYDVMLKDAELLNNWARATFMMGKYDLAASFEKDAYKFYDMIIFEASKNQSKAKSTNTPKPFWNLEKNEHKNELLFYISVGENKLGINPLYLAISDFIGRYDTVDYKAHTVIEKKIADILVQIVYDYVKEENIAQLEACYPYLTPIFKANYIDIVETAIDNGKVEIVSFFIKKHFPMDVLVRGYSFLHMAAKKWDIPIMDLLVKNNINVNVKDEIFGDAPVISAMLALNSESTVDNKKQCLETIKFLQSKGAVIQFYRNNGAPNESFHRVCEARYLPLIEFLVNNGAGLVINEYCLGVPAYFAYPREDNNYEPIKYLIDNGADICVKRFSSLPEPFLNYIISMNCTDEFFKYALGKCPNVDCADDRGRAPLHEAVYKNKLSYVNMLIDKNANVNIKDKFDNTPLHLAVENNYSELVTILIDKGADKNIQNYYKETPLDIAKKKNNKDLIKLLKN